MHTVCDIPLSFEREVRPWIIQRFGSDEWLDSSLVKSEEWWVQDLDPQASAEVQKEYEKEWSEAAYKRVA